MSPARKCFVERRAQITRIAFDDAWATNEASASAASTRMSCRLWWDDIASKEAGRALINAEASGASLSISLAEAEASFAASSKAFVWPRLNLNAINDAVVPPSSNESGTSFASHLRTYSSSNASLDALGASFASAATIRGACPSKEANNDVAKSEPPQAKGTNCGASMAAQPNRSEAARLLL